MEHISEKYIKKSKFSTFWLIAFIEKEIFFLRNVLHLFPKEMYLFF